MLKCSLSEETTVRSTLSERESPERIEQQPSLISKATLRLKSPTQRPNPDATTETQSQLSTLPNLSIDTSIETEETALRATIPSLDRPELRDDDGYSNTAYLENISAALGSHSSGLQQSTLSPTTTSSSWSSLASSGGVQMVNRRRRRRRKREDRRKKAFAKLVQHLGRSKSAVHDEVYGERRPPRSCSSVHLKSVIRRGYLPEHVLTDAGNGCSGKAGNHVMPGRYHYHRPASYSSRYDYFCCCRCCAWKNCGNCSLLKVFVILTLLIAILFCLASRCGTPVDRKACPPSSPHPPSNHSSTTKVFNGKNATSMPSSSSVIISGNWTSHNWIETRKPTLAGVNATTKNSSSASAVPVSEVHCPFRNFYFVLLSLGLLLYLSIFLTYTCKLVVHYHHFPWFLSEAIAVGFFSVLLFVASIIGLLLKRQTVSSALGLIDALLGFAIAFSAYLSHSYGLMPIMNISVDDDPDCNQLNRILGEKQFSRIVRGR